MLAAGRLNELLAQLADEHVDDLQLGHIHPTVEVVEEHLLGQRRPFAQAQELEDAVFFAGQVQRLVVHSDGTTVEINQQLAGADCRVGMALRAADDRLNARYQFAMIERLGQEVVGAEAQALNLVIERIEPRQDEDRGTDPGRPQLPQHLISGRCAVYTRKSSEEGLEQDFNSLHAQREACEAFIRSQRGEGWRLIETAYDDGGLSGGTLERPALQRLFADIAQRRVETVVVYKVDRLTRSLMDFAKIVELFDRHGVTLPLTTFRPS